MHAGEEGRIEWQHALRRCLVFAVSDRVEARGCTAELITARKKAASASSRK